MFYVEDTNSYVGDNKSYVGVSNSYVGDNKFCLCWGFTAQSTQWGHVERGQFT